MEPPRYDETFPAVDSLLAKNTDQAYNLRAYYHISALAFKSNFPDYDPKLPIRFGSRRRCVTAVITSPEGKIIRGKTLSSNFQEKVLIIDYECSDLKKLQKIYEYMQYDHLKKTAASYAVSHSFCSSMIKSFKYDEENDTHFIKTEVENPSFVGFRRFYGWNICNHSHTYTLHLNYLNASFLDNDTNSDYYKVVALNYPVSTLLMHGDKTINYEKLSKGNDEPVLTVVYKAENLEELNTVKNFLTNPQYCQNTEKFKLRDSTYFQVSQVCGELPEGNRQCTIKNPFTVILCCDSSFIQLDNFIYLNCNSHGSSCKFW